MNESWSMNVNFKRFLRTSVFLLMVGSYSYLKYLINANEGVSVNALHLVQRGSNNSTLL